MSKPDCVKNYEFLFIEKYHEENRTQATNSKDIFAAHLPTNVINVQNMQTTTLRKRQIRVRE